MFLLGMEDVRRTILLVEDNQELSSNLEQTTLILSRPALTA